MRPQRPDIAVPPFPPQTGWIGAGEPRMEALTASGPALVHFFDFAQLNSVRTLPYLRAWRDRYADRGLSIVGVHSPRYPFTEDPEAVAAGIERLGVPYPVALDAERRMWRDYGCRGWPSLFLWRTGGALAWFHFGEGEYRATEGAIRELLPEGRGDLPDPLRPLRPEDAPGAAVIAPSPEVFPGGAVERPWPADGDQRRLNLSYAAGGAYASVAGAGTLAVGLDSGPARTIEIEVPGLCELAAHPRHEEHRLELEAGPGIAVHSLSFSAGVPP